MDCESKDLDAGSVADVSDEVLVCRYQKLEDREAFSELVHRYERELFTYLKRYLGDAEMAEDVFQATFLQIHLKSNQFETGRKFRPWLYTVATNQAIDAQRRAKRHRAVSLDQRGRGDGDNEVGALVDLLASHEESPDVQVDHKEEQARMRTAFQELPSTLQNVVNLVYFQGLKYTEAAEVLELPLGTVKSRLHAALHKLNVAWHQSSSAHRN
jgi:RNA polymerase sigma-70 factor (ECF subfamily)